MEDNDMASLIPENVKAKQQDQDTLSAEDFAWADSCLVEDPELSETNMNSLKEALLDILDLHSEILGSPSANEPKSNEMTDPEKVPSVMEEGTSYTADISIDQGTSYTAEMSINEESSYTAEMSINKETSYAAEMSINEGTSYAAEMSINEGTSYTADISIDEHQEQESYDVLSILKQQPFLPNYNDEMMKVQYSDDDDVGFLLSEFMTGPLSDDIFKVWDLDIPIEEDELAKELKEALSAKAGTKVTKGVRIESVDSLVEGLADLSLK